MSKLSPTPEKLKLSPQPPSEKTIEEQAKKYLAGLNDEKLQEFLTEVNNIKNKKINL